MTDTTFSARMPSCRMRTRLLSMFVSIFSLPPVYLKLMEVIPRNHGAGQAYVFLHRLPVQVTVCGLSRLPAYGPWALGAGSRHIAHIQVALKSGDPSIP